ncbi:MAG: carotenoid 1,2-hydratase [Pseudomonadota bacterium]
MMVPPGGYGWWYADAISQDGRFGFSIIIMIGSVFSPYYAWSGHKDPENHVAFNVGLYGKGVRRWTLTERGRGAISRTPHALKIGPSSVAWDGESCVITIHEVAAPFPQRVTGTITLKPRWRTASPYALDTQGKHFWHPIAPAADVNVSFEKPAMRWTGEAYFDSNWGTEMLEEGFRSWDWCRAPLPDGAGIYYDAILKNGDTKRLALRYHSDGTVLEMACPPATNLSPGPIWRVARTVPTQAGTQPQTLTMLEDTPFYTRSRVQTHFDGTPATAIHESLDLRRFSRQWVRYLLPFKMPRRA